MGGCCGEASGARIPVEVLRNPSGSAIPARFLRWFLGEVNLEVGLARAAAAEMLAGLAFQWAFLAETALGVALGRLQWLKL